MNRYDNFTTEDFIGKLNETGWAVVQGKSSTVFLNAEEDKRIEVSSTYGTHMVIAILATGLQPL